MPGLLDLTQARGIEGKGFLEMEPQLSLSHEPLAGRQGLAQSPMPA